MNSSNSNIYFMPLIVDNDFTNQIYTPCLTPPSTTILADNNHNYLPQYQSNIQQSTITTGLSRSNSQPDLKHLIEIKSSPPAKVRRHPSFNLSNLNGQDDFYFELNTPTTTDDGIFLGTDFASDLHLSTNGGCDTFSDIFDDLEGLMSCVTFDAFNSNLEDYSTKSTVSCDAQTSSKLDDTRLITRSAPPSPTPMMRENKRNTNWPFKLSWNKMSLDEKTKCVELLTRIINDEMGLREQLEIIRIINPDTKFLPTNTQFILDLNMIDDEKFRRIRELIKFHGIKFSDKLNSDNCSECSANSCPQTKIKQRELRLRRAQQRILKHTQRKESRQILKESKSGLFIKTEVIPLSTVLPEEDIEVDILG